MWPNLVWFVEGAQCVPILFDLLQVHSVTQKRRPESIISEMELNNIIVEQLIEFAEDVFA